jgi:hypothetical protein
MCAMRRGRASRLVLFALAAVLATLGLGATAAPAGAVSIYPAPGASSGMASSGPVVRQLDPYLFQTCVLLPDGSPLCWAKGYPGGESEPGGTYTMIGIGGGGSCGLTAASAVSCWTDSPDGSPPPSSGTYAQVAGGYDDDCALSTSGAMTCWGVNALSTQPGPFTAIGVGYQGACGITTSAAIDCYSTGSTWYSPPPQGTYTALTLGLDFACALSTSQAISCWGDNTDGQLGAPATGRYVAVSAGRDFACALSTTGEITCWGNDTDGQLNSPKGKFTAVAAGTAGEHACAIATSGYVRCWGFNNNGQLGMAPYLNPGPIPFGLAGSRYFADLGLPDVTVTMDLDGSPPGTFTVTKGAVPAGLNLDPLYGLLQGVTTRTGAYPFTVSISNVEGSVSVRYDIIVLGYFLGFKHPAAGAHISRSARSVPVSFRIGSYNGSPVTASHARTLLLKVTLSRASNGSHPLTHAACRYSNTARAFQCTLGLPRNISTGRYFLTAYQQSGSGYEPCPKGKARSDLNPERIYIRR